MNLLARCTASLCLYLGLAAAAPLAQATVVTYYYTAAGLADSGSAGATVTGTFGFDTSVADSRPEQEIGTYIGSGFITALVSGGTQDSQSVNLTGLHWEVVDMPAGTGADWLLTVESPTFVLLGDLLGAALDSDALPTTLSLDAFGSNRNLQIANDGVGAEQYWLTSISLDPGSTEVPEPSSLALLGAAGIGMGWVRRKGRKRR